MEENFSFWGGVRGATQRPLAKRGATRPLFAPKKIKGGRASAPRGGKGALRAPFWPRIFLKCGVRGGRVAPAPDPGEDPNPGSGLPRA